MNIAARLVSIRTLCLALFLALAVTAAGPGYAASIAMVTDLQGKAALGTGSARAPVALLADLEPGAQVDLDANARMVVLYLDGSGEYSFKGPALIAFRAQQPEVLKGAPAEKRSMLGGKAGKDVRIKSVGVVQGAMVMRSAGPRARIRLLNPSGIRTLESRPEFRWQAEQPGLTYRFELTDETGRTLYETELAATSLTLPASVTLSENVAYTWTISARFPDARKYSSTGDFSIATPSMRREVEALRPAANAAFSDRVAYAAWLEQAELKDEARSYWRKLAAERPGDGRLEELSRE
jgi:hypothetical protein